MPQHQVYRTRFRVSLAFSIVFLFVIAQVVWWYVFLHKHTGERLKMNQQSWQRDQAALSTLLQKSKPDAREKLLKTCRTFYPHLSCSAQGIVVRQKMWNETVSTAQRSLRMLMFEGAFFFAVIAFGLYLLALGFRTERELRLRQQNFLNAVSHELRTPIGSMRLLVDSLVLRKLSEEKRERYLHRINGQLDRLQTTCEQILAAAMLEGEKAKKHAEHKELNTEIRRLLAEFKHEFQEQGVTIEFVPAEEPMDVFVEQISLSVILHNLLENAVKYNDKEETQVGVCVRRKGRWAECSVEDNGPGIDPTEQKKIFDAFYRVGDELNRQTTGLGLGLYLVKGLSEAMRGRVRYEALASGSRFVVSLPLRESNHSTQQAV